MNPGEFNPLRQYALHILGGSITNLRPPKSDAMHQSQNTPGITSVVIDRQGQYQAELFMVPPNVKEIRSHVHPGVDSFEYHIAGDYEFIIDGYHHMNKNDGGPILHSSILGQVDATVPHAGNFTTGGSFISFQFWRDRPPTSVSDSFSDQV